MTEIQLKTTPALMVLAIENKGSKNDLFQDLARIFEYLYDNNLQQAISGPGMGIFFSDSVPGEYLAAVPLKEKILPAAGHFRLMRLPETECASLVHKGELKEIDKALVLLKQYLVKSGLAGGQVRREIYLGANVTDGTLTEIQLPLKITATRDLAE